MPTCLVRTLVTRFTKFALVFIAVVTGGIARAEHDGKVQVLLLGDSTTIGSVCRLVEPKGPHLEDVIRILLAAEATLPPVNVINEGAGGEYIHGLLKSRYDRDIAPLRDSGIDYIFIRYGINDRRKRENFAENFPKDYGALLARLRQDFPQATLIPTTTIPYLGEETDAEIWKSILAVGAAENLPVFELHKRYADEMKRGPNMLNYRRFPHDQIPEPHREWTKAYVLDGRVVVMDNRLDAHFGHLENWFGDRHPNLAGYHVIGDETAKYLAGRFRDRSSN